MIKPKTLEEAITFGCESVHPLEGEYVELKDAFMRIAAMPIINPMPLPNFNRSAMDGYAITKTDLEKLANNQTLTLPVTGTIKAGSMQINPLKRGEAYRIMTGALLPENCAAVIKQEEVRVKEDLICVPPGRRKLGENIREAGHEVKADEQIAAKGQVLKPEFLERIAACGIAKICVHKAPRIFVMETGNELLLPGDPYKEGHIYGSNRNLIAGKIAAAGATPLLSDKSIKDDLPAIVREIEKAAHDADMVIISGGTGNGMYDLVYQAFESLKAKPLFKGVAITPGKGTAAVLYKGKLLYNLSGNPYAAGLLFEALVKPVLLKLKGDLFPGLEWFNIPLGGPVDKLKSVRSLGRGEMKLAQGRVYAYPIGKKVLRNIELPLILDLKPGQGKVGDEVRAKLYSG